METWILVADEQHAALLVQSSVGSLHEIETWDCIIESPDSELDFADKIARRVECLQTDFDNLVVAAPPQLLWNLSIAFGDNLNGKVAAGLARDLTQLSCKQLRSELYQTLTA